MRLLYLIAVVVLFTSAGCLTNAGVSDQSTPIEETATSMEDTATPIEDTVTPDEETATSDEDTATTTVSETNVTAQALAYVENYSIDPTSGMDENTTVSGTTENVTFTYVTDARDIPNNTSTGTDPATVNETVAPASVEPCGAGEVEVTLYTWSETNGILTRWNVTVGADGDVQSANGTAVAVGVGDYRPITEGPTVAPEPGQVFINESVS